MSHIWYYSCEKKYFFFHSHYFFPPSNPNRPPIINDAHFYWWNTMRILFSFFLKVVFFCKKTILSPIYIHHIHKKWIIRPYFLIDDECPDGIYWSVALLQIIPPKKYLLLLLQSLISQRRNWSTCLLHIYWAWAFTKLFEKWDCFSRKKDTVERNERFLHADESSMVSSAWMIFWSFFIRLRLRYNGKDDFYLSFENRLSILLKNGMSQVLFLTV